MTKFWLGCLLVCVVGLTALAQPQGAGYQAGKIVNVERLQGTGGGGGHRCHAKAGNRDL